MGTPICTQKLSAPLELIHLELYKHPPLWLASGYPYTEDGNNSNVLFCEDSKRRHDRECMDYNRCFLCVEAEHMMRDCPKYDDQTPVPAMLNPANTGDVTRNNLVLGISLFMIV